MKIDALDPSVLVPVLCTVMVSNLGTVQKWNRTNDYLDGR